MKRKRRKLLLIAIALLVLLCIFLVLYLKSDNENFFNVFQKKVKNDTVEVEVGEPVQIETESQQTEQDQDGTDADEVQGGSDFLIPIAINTFGKSINAAEIYYDYDPEKVKIREIVRASSVFSLWIEAKTYFDNSTGRLMFVGALPHPGFNGVGKLSEIRVSAKGKEDIVLSPSDRSAIAKNDGEGSLIKIISK